MRRSIDVGTYSHFCFYRLGAKKIRGGAVFVVSLHIESKTAASIETCNVRRKGVREIDQLLHMVDVHVQEYIRW